MIICTIDEADHDAKVLVTMIAKVESWMDERFFLGGNDVDIYY